VFAVGSAYRRKPNTSKVSGIYSPPNRRVEERSHGKSLIIYFPIVLSPFHFYIVFGGGIMEARGIGLESRGWKGFGWDGWDLDSLDLDWLGFRLE
jgi:hypothetical protein